MKKLFRLFPLLFVAVLALGATSCSDDKDEPVSSAELPAKAQEFVSTYFPTATITLTTKDKDEYEVFLSEGTRIDFNKAGEWQDVDAAPGKVVPSGFYPAAIDENVAEVAADAGINEISKESYGYEVELLSGLEMKFDQNGAFISFDK
ncbi:MAG: PepSY-like domain-containing protein [Muribaculaceae bacterium]|nr:PepSY-like domain-containing protein [Muribaculaceae bacterium]